MPLHFPAQLARTGRVAPCIVMDNQDNNVQGRNQHTVTEAPRHPEGDTPTLIANKKKINPHQTMDFQELDRTGTRRTHRIEVQRSQRQAAQHYTWPQRKSTRPVLRHKPRAEDKLQASRATQEPKPGAPNQRTT